MHNPQLTTLRSLILQVRQNLESLDVHDSRMTQSRELLDAAVVLADDLIETPPAPMIRMKGGKATAKRGPNKDADHSKRIAGMRKNATGARPKN